MSSQGLWHDIRKNPFVLVIVILFHVVLIVLLSFNLIDNEVPKSATQNKPTIKAVVVDASQFDAEVEKKKRAELEKKQQKIDAENRRKQDEEKKRKQQEAKKREQAEQEKKKQQAVAQQREAEKKQAALKNKQAEEAKRVEEAKRQAVLEKQRKEAEAKQQAELEKQRKEAEVKRQAELKRQEEAAKQKRLAEEAEARRKQEEADLKSRLEEEERREEEARQQAEYSRMLDSLRLQYVKLIEQKVERNWLRPPGLKSNVSCEVIVTQTIMGDVTSVSLRNCEADSTFQQSIERAVWKASPLPPAPNPDVYDREIHFTFRPR